MVASHSWDTAGAANVGIHTAFDLTVESFAELADELE